MIIRKKKLYRFGGSKYKSYAVTLPVPWIRYNLKPDKNGKYWVRLEIENKIIRVYPASP